MVIIASVPIPDGELAALCDLVTPMVMRATVALGLADALATRPRPVEAVAGELGVDAAALTRLVAFLAARGVVAVDPSGGDDGRRAVRLTERGAPLAAAEPGGSWPSRLDWAGAAGHLDRMFVESLLPALRTGRCRHDVWATLDGSLGRSFDELMAARAVEWVPPVVELGLWADVRRVVDVGGGRGHLLRALLSAWPHLEGTLVERSGPAAWAAREAHPRLAVVVGDLRADPPPGRDAYVLAHVLHDWPDEAAAGILRGAGRAAADDGRVLVVERLLDDPATRRETTHQDLRMLVLFGGRERTRDQFAALGAAAGLRLSGTAATGAGRHVLTFRIDP